MRALFVSRKHPPSVGGMQRLSYHLVSEMRDRLDVTAITWGGSQKFLPLFWSYALVRSLCVGWRGIDLVHLGDPIMAPIGWVLQKLFGVPAVVTVHGLDITYPWRWYQWFIPRLLQRADRVVCISNRARDACVDRNIPAHKCEVIYPGVAVPSVVFPRDVARKWLAGVLGRDLDGIAVLLTVGRLVPRKGVAWFVESVLPQVLANKADLCYVVAGSGPDENRVRSLATQAEVEGNVYILGQIAESDLALVYAAADLFVMPNLPTPGDMEGFGLVALEAAAHTLPVLAADLEGIRDAVIPGSTGYLQVPGDADLWGKTIDEMLVAPDTLQAMGRRARTAVAERFTWTHMADAYEVVFREVVEAESRQ